MASAALMALADMGLTILIKQSKEFHKYGYCAIVENTPQIAYGNSPGIALRNLLRIVRSNITKPSLEESIDPIEEAKRKMLDNRYHRRKQPGKAPPLKLPKYSFQVCSTVGCSFVADTGSNWCRLCLQRNYDSKNPNFQIGR